MDVEHRRNALGTMLAECALHERERKLSKIPAAGRREPEGSPQTRGERKFEKRPIRTRLYIRNWRRSWPAIVRPTNRENTGVVQVTFFEQDLECELGVRCDREARRAVP